MDKDIVRAEDWGQGWPGEQHVAQRLASEDVVLASPLSFQGATVRIMRGINLEKYSGWGKTGMVTLAVCALTLAYSFIVCWYTMFGIMLVPFRLLRRTQRTGKRNQLRHRELLASAQRNIQN